MKHKKNKRICVMLLGGTISCKMLEDGTSVTTDITTDVYSLCKPRSGIDVYINSFAKLGGYETTIHDLVKIAEEIKRIIREENPDGIVVVMGTNVLEEAAFAVNLMVSSDTPIIFTGAMRIPEAPGADGPANISDAITAAASEVCRGKGVLVVFNNRIHAADYVRKEHTQNCDAITSDFCLGFVSEGKVSLRTIPILRRMPWLQVKDSEKKVLLYTSYLGDTGDMIDLLGSTDYVGAVFEGTGGGYFALWVFEKIERISKKIPVVIASRIGHGDVMSTTYGEDYGMPGYMTKQGFINAGQLDSRKSRILLTLLLMSGCNQSQIKQSFYMYSKDYFYEEV